MKDSTAIKTQFDRIARQYDEGRRCFIPCFDDYYHRSLSLLKTIKPQASHITDLGAGTGLLTQEMYMLYPEAHYTLLDLSAEMLDVARQRFAGIDSFEYLTGDYSAAYDAWWFDYIDRSGISPEAKAKWQQRKQLDREVSVETTVAMLRAAASDRWSASTSS